MFKTMLVVVDGQDALHPASELALSWSADLGATLYGVGIVDEELINPLEPVPLGAGEAKRSLDASRLKERQLAVNESLAALATRGKGHGVAFTPLRPSGRSVDELLVESQRYDAIVMPRHTLTSAESFGRGESGALWKVLHASPRPVITVPVGAATGRAAVIAYDGSLQAARALQAFAYSDWAARHPVHVVSIDNVPAVAVAHGQRAIDFLANHAIAAQLHAVTRTGDTAEHLIETAQQLGAGLLVMGAYGRPRICEFFLGSVTRALLSDCLIPLFLFH